MPLWTRVSHAGREWIGTIESDTIVLHEGDMFANPRATGKSIPRSEAKLLTPTTPSKMLGLVDNYHALVTKLGHAVPAGAALLSESQQFIPCRRRTDSRPAGLRRQGRV